MGFSLTIKQRLLLSHLVTVVVLAGAYGAFVYFMAAQQVVERMRVRLDDSAAAMAASFESARLDAGADAAARAGLATRLQNALRGNSDLARAFLVRNDGTAEQVLAASGDEAEGKADLDTRFPVPGHPGVMLGAELRHGVIAEHLYTLRLSAALAFLVCVLAALVMSRILAGRFQHSITDIVARCRALANGEHLPPRHTGPRDEFDDLAREFDTMAGRLKAAAEGREQAAAALREANANLERRVRERTAEIEGANAKLKQEIEGRVHVEALLGEAALTDPLTGLLNRRAMMEMLSQSAPLLKAGEAGLSVILADVDHFKRINDVYGHSRGDQVLAAIAGLLREGFTELQHNVARWGGEEFLILLPGTRLAAACKRAEVLRRNVADTDIGDEKLKVTVSLGVAELVHGEDIDDCLRRCDQALYKAKDAGRNAVVAAQGQLFATMS